MVALPSVFGTNSTNLTFLWHPVINKQGIKIEQKITEVRNPRESETVRKDSLKNDSPTEPTGDVEHYFDHHELGTCELEIFVRIESRIKLANTIQIRISNQIRV